MEETLMYQKQLLVIGAGPGGYVAAIKAAQLGLSVAIAENRDVGGTCLNRGCIPTKTLLHAAQLFAAAQSFEAIGLHIEGLSYDVNKLYARKDEVVGQLRGGIEQLLKGNKIELLRGTAAITAPHCATLTGGGETRQITAENIIIATGSVPSRPPIEGLELPNVLTSDELLLQSDKVFKRLVIIGGGVIGVEFASVFGALGCEITIIEALDRLLPAMDREISQNLTMLLKKRGASVHIGSRVQKIVQNGSELCCEFTEKEAAQAVYADGILVAIGRRPNTQELFEDGFTLKMNRSAIAVDENCLTSAEGIYAIGDVTAGIQLAHFASAQGIMVAEALAGHKPNINMNIIPSCIYTSPEIACVGITADEAKERGIETKTGKAIMSANGKTLIEGGGRGFIKLVFSAKDEVLLGAQLMCERATDIISELTTAVVQGITARQLTAVVRPHPTFTEAVTEAVDDALGGAIHAAPKRKQ
ncbi:MAG: dihydrolipoyl dehydrogenase [Hydrogenoanaerobacterium sp.]